MTRKQARRFLARNRTKLTETREPRKALLRRADMARKILRRQKG